MTFDENFRLWIYGPAMVNVQSKPIDERDFEDIPKLRRYMMEVMWKANGIGLAAPQIGLFKQYVLVVVDQGLILDLVNPYITRMCGRENWEYEGCLSIPPSGNDCLVPRMDTVYLDASLGDSPDVRREFVFTGIASRIVQHEVDHLTGTFFVERAKDNNRREVLERFSGWKSMRKAQSRTVQKGNGNVDAGFVSSQGGRTRLS